MPARRRPLTGPYPRTIEERRQMAAVLEWIMDGRPLTTAAERLRHERLRGALAEARRLELVG